MEDLTFNWKTIEFAFLTSSWVMLLVQGPHLEKNSLRAIDYIATINPEFSGWFYYLVILFLSAKLIL